MKSPRKIKAIDGPLSVSFPPICNHMLSCQGQHDYSLEMNKGNMFFLSYNNFLFYSSTVTTWAPSQAPPLDNKVIDINTNISNIFDLFNRSSLISLTYSSIWVTGKKTVSIMAHHPFSYPLRTPSTVHNLLTWEYLGHWQLMRGDDDSPNCDLSVPI